MSSVITSFSSFWMMLLRCAVSLKSFCLLWCSMVFAWICFSMYLLDGTAEKRLVFASFYLLNYDIIQKKMLKVMHLCILLYSLRLCSRSSFNLWLRSWLVFTCTTHVSNILITLGSWTSKIIITFLYLWAMTVKKMPLYKKLPKLFRTWWTAVPNLLFGLSMFSLHVSQTCVQLLEELVDLCVGLGQSGLFHLQSGDVLLQLLHTFL